VFVAELEPHVPAEELRDRVVQTAGLYPHLVDASGARDLPHPGKGT
jgi:hypothetical protein